MRRFSGGEMPEVLGKLARIAMVALAAGRWIAGHGTVPATDTLSHTVRGHRWIDLEWLYEVVIDLLHSMGGPVLLSVAAAFCFTLAVWLLLRLVRPHLGDTGGVLLTLLVVLVILDRFTVRAEMASFPLLVGVLSVLAIDPTNLEAQRLLP